VKGKMNSAAVAGFIGSRRGRFFIVVDEAPQKRAGVKPGDAVKVEVQPRNVLKTVSPQSSQSTRRKTRG
jgi:hypothetical protein